MSITKKSLLELYEEFPFERHPFWVSVLNGEFSLSEVLLGEKQHYLRTKAGQRLRKMSALEARELKSEKILGAAFENYLEEVSPKNNKDSHLSLIKKLLMEGGVTTSELDEAIPTPGNIAAIALYENIASRGAGCHLLGAGVVEHYYSQLCPKIYKAYTDIYNMTKEQAYTYYIHGFMDQVHANRAFEAMDDVISQYGETTVWQAVRDAFVATSLHYDGMYQGATGETVYWGGA